MVGITAQNYPSTRNAVDSMQNANAVIFQRRQKGYNILLSLVTCVQYLHHVSVRPLTR